MKIPNKKELQLNQLEAKRQQAFRDNDVAAFQAAISEIESIRDNPDVYTCPQCGKDFEGDHLEILVASLEVIENREMTFELDMGVGEVIRDARLGRHIKFCKSCTSTWVIPISTYMQMR